MLLHAIHVNIVIEWLGNTAWDDHALCHAYMWVAYSYTPVYKLMV